MSSSDLERRIIRAEQLLWRLGAGLDKLDEGVGRAKQAGFMASVVAGGYAPGGCLTTLTGVTVGCNYDNDPTDTDTWLPGCRIRIVGQHTGTHYGDFDCAPDGTFAADVRLLSDFSSYPAGDYDDFLSVFVAGPGPRFYDDLDVVEGAGLGTTVDVASNHRCPFELTTDLGAIPAVVASGFQPLNLILNCLYPVSNTLTWEDSVIGTGTATGNPGWQIACVNATSTAPTCPNPFNSGVLPNMNNALQYWLGAWIERLGAPNFQFCPKHFTCPTTPTTGFQLISGIGSVVKVLPDATYPKFSWTMTSTSTAEKNFHNGTAYTTKFYEQ